MAIEDGDEAMVIWKAYGIKLVYNSKEPWPYTIEMDNESESRCLLDEEEITSLMDALIEHLPAKAAK